MKLTSMAVYEEQDDLPLSAWIKAEAPLQKQSAVGMRAPKFDAPGDIGSYGWRGGGGDPDFG